MQELGRDESECGPDREEPHHGVGPEHGIRPPEAEIDLAGLSANRRASLIAIRVLPAW